TFPIRRIVCRRRARPQGGGHARGGGTATLAPADSPPTRTPPAPGTQLSTTLGHPPCCATARRGDAAGEASPSDIQVAYVMAGIHLAFSPPLRLWTRTHNESSQVDRVGSPDHPRGPRDAPRATEHRHRELCALRGRRDPRTWPGRHRWERRRELGDRRALLRVSDPRPGVATLREHRPHSPLRLQESLRERRG